MSRLSLTIQTWHEPENFGLFDFDDGTKTTRNTFILESEHGFLCRFKQTQDLMLISKDNIKKYADRAVLQIRRTEHGFAFQPMNGQGNAQDLFKIVSQEDGGQRHRLHEGDEIKLGHVTMNILHLSHIKQPKVEKTKHFSPEQSGMTTNVVAQGYDIHPTILFSQCSGLVESDARCRYCYSQKSTPQNRLVDCCGCKGQSNFVHRNCVKQWIKNKLRMGHINDVLWFQKSAITCELCRQLFDLKLILQLTYPKKITNFCVIGHSEEPNTIYVFPMFGRTKIVIGRGSKADLSIHNETVSKRHCIISLNSQNNTFSVCDLKSKFGTRVKIKKVIKRNMMIQFGRYAIDANILPPRKNIFQILWSLCNPYIDIQEEERHYRKNEQDQIRQLDG